MQVYENSIDEEELSPIARGFLSALVEDAEQSFEENDQQLYRFNNKDYNMLCEYKFSVANLNPDTIDYGLGIVQDFCDAMTEEQAAVMEDMNEDEQADLGKDLYQALLYDGSIMPVAFQSALDAMDAVEGSAFVGEDMSGDVRIFFE